MSPQPITPAPAAVPARLPHQVALAGRTVGFEGDFAPERAASLARAVRMLGGAVADPDTADLVVRAPQANTGRLRAHRARGADVFDETAFTMRYRP